MKENLTEIICLLDRSGSMNSIITDAIGGFNKFLKDQKEVLGEAKLTLALFDDEYEIIHNGINIQSVPELNSLTYVPRGWTALYDAVGKTINTVGERLAKLSEEERPSKVIFVILTDGHENSSKEFTGQKIKEMIKHQKEKYSWMFVFLGANLDANKTASGMGISNSIQFASNGISQNKAYHNVSSFMSRTRSLNSVDYAATLDCALNDEEKNAE